MYRLRLRDLREDADITQAQMAEKLQCTQSCYSKYEKGKLDIPTETLITAAEYFNVTLDYMCGLTDDPAPPKRNNGALRNETDLHSHVKGSI